MPMAPDGELELLPELEAALRLVVHREGAQPNDRSLAALDGLGLATRDCPAVVSARAVSELAALAPELAAAFAGLHPSWRRPLLSRATLVSVRQGLFRYLLAQVHHHAEIRVMFGRRLAEQPVIRLRLVGVAAHLAWADYLADNLDAPGVPSLLQDTLDRARDVLQLTCGGTGYMAESSFGQAVQWLDACERSLHPVRDEIADGTARERWLAPFLADTTRALPLEPAAMAWLLEDARVAC